MATAKGKPRDPHQERFWQEAIEKRQRQSSHVNGRLGLAKHLVRETLVSVLFGPDQSKNQLCELITAMFAEELPPRGPSEQQGPMPLTFDAGKGRAGNVRCELTTPLFGKNPIGVAKYDMRWLVP